MVIPSLIAAVISISTNAWMLLSVTGIVIIYIVGIWNFGFFRKRGVPEVGNPWPFFGNFHRVIFGKETFQDWIYNSYMKFKGQRIYGIFQFQRAHLVINDIELVKAITVKDFDHFTDHQKIFSEKHDRLLRQNLFNLDGREWKIMRNTLSPAFTSSKMKYLFKLMDDCGKGTVSYIKEKISTSPDSVLETDMKDFFTRFTNDCIATSAFGIQVNSHKDRNNDFFKMGQEVGSTSLVRFLTVFAAVIFPDLMGGLGFSFIPKRVSDYFHNIVVNAVRERQRRGIVRPDMLQLLMQAKEGQLNAEKGDEEEMGSETEKKVLTDSDITAQALFFFLAGFETVATLMSYTSMCLALHPHIQDKLHREIDEVLEATEGAFSYETMQDMKYLDMVLNEVLRRYFVILLDRKCIKDYTVPATDNAPGFTIHKGDNILIPQGGIHLDPEYWPEPEKFDPERFSDENKTNIKPFTYMPFGLGPRMCIGNRFALMETKIVFVHILRHFNIVATPKTPKEIKFAKFSLNSSIEGGFWVGFEKRQ